MRTTRQELYKKIAAASLPLRQAEEILQHRVRDRYDFLWSVLDLDIGLFDLAGTVRTLEWQRRGLAREFSI